MSQANVELVQASYEEFNKTGQPQLQIYDPAIEWHTRADLPDSGVHRGHEALGALAAEWVGSFEDLRFEIEDIIDRGDYVVVPMVLRGRVRGSDEEVAMSETHVAKIHDAVVVEVREYRTLQEALKAVGLTDG
jgi:ketosteroid isomerase-like protein